MNSSLGDIIISRIADLPFMDKYAGVTKIIQQKSKSGKNLVFPAYTRLIIDECEPDGNVGVYGDLCPNTAFKSVLYLEDKGSRVVKREGAYIYWKSTFDIVCWLNLPKLGYTMDQGFRYSATAVNGIISALPQTPFNSGVFHRVLIQPVAQQPQNANPFSKFSFEESITQYLLYPYDFFVLTVDVDFAVNKHCLEAMPLGTPEACVNTSPVRNAIIEDQDGNIVRRLRAGETYRVIVASGIDEGGPAQEYTIQVVDIGLND